jgi:hypothetical protein
MYRIAFVHSSHVLNKLNNGIMANYLKYTKLILRKMSFCPHLLNKEYKKCVAFLSRQEIVHLKEWLRRQRFARELNL